MEPQIDIQDSEIVLKMKDDPRSSDKSHDIDVVLDKSDFGPIGFEIVGLKQKLKLSNISIDNFENDRVKIHYSPQDDAFYAKFKFITDKYVTSEPMQGKVMVNDSNEICSF